MDKKLLNTIPENEEQTEVENLFYYQILSPTNAEKLIRYWTTKGISKKNIALFCSYDFVFKVELYCGGNIQADINPDTENNNYKIVISTKEDKLIKFPNHRKVLLNLDDKIDAIGWDEVYTYYTNKAKSKKVREYPLLKFVIKRNWKSLFVQYSEFYRERYMYLNHYHYYKYLEINPFVISKDNLWIPDFCFTKWDKNLNDNIYNIVVYLNRTLAYPRQIYNEKCIDFIPTFDDREYNPVIVTNSSIRETLIYFALTEKFDDYICFDIDFNSCFQNIILRATGTIEPQQYIDFKDLTENGRCLTLEDVYNIGGKGMKEGTKKEFIKSFESGGSVKLAKSFINAIFNGFGRWKDKNARDRIEKGLKWLINYDWDTVDFSKLDNLDWLNKDSFFLSARAEKHLREELKKNIQHSIPKTDYRFINMHDGIMVFCPIQKEGELNNFLQSGVLTIKTPCPVEYNGNTLELMNGCIFPYKCSTNLPNKIERDNFVKLYDLKDKTPLVYNQIGKSKGKAIGKNKHQFLYNCPTSKFINEGIYTREQIEAISTRKDVSVFIKKCNCKRKLA